MAERGNPVPIRPLVVPAIRAKPTLVGEANSLGADPSFALYPMPERCSGERLCCLVLGMYKRDYLSYFRRLNLCPNEWSAKRARWRAAEIALEGGKLVLLGAKVAASFGALYEPFMVRKMMRCGHGEALVLSHPSGRCRTWNDPLSFQRTRDALATFCPDVAPMLGRYSKEE